MNCIRCDKVLVMWDVNNKTKNHPLKGSEFIAHGHYGSRVTDTKGRTIHIINLCDDCCEYAKTKGLCKEMERE